MAGRVKIFSVASKTGRLRIIATVALIALIPLTFTLGFGPQQRGGNDRSDVLTKEQVQARTEAHRQQHRDNFHPVSLFLPYYSIAPGTQTSLYLMNMFSDPITVRITVFSPRGQAYFPIYQEVEPNTYADVSLNEVLANAGRRFVDGSVKVEYLGQPMLMSHSGMGEIPRLQAKPLGGLRYNDACRDTGKDRTQSMSCNITLCLSRSTASRS